MNRKWTIYCHTHIESGRRYVGQTVKTMSQRWAAHVHDARKPSAGWFFASAIRKYGASAFSHEVLEVCGNIEDANVAEAKWIKHYTTRDPLFGFNLLRGGTRVEIPQTKEEVRAKMGAGSKARWDDPEGRAKVLAAQRDPEARAKQSAAAIARWKDPAYRARHTQRLIAQTHTAETRRKQAATLRGRTKLNDEQIAIVRKWHARGFSQSSLARSFGVLRETVARYLLTG